jgi:cytochrome c oxidase subunit II
LLRRGAVVALVSIALIVAIATTAIAYFIDWLPDQASEERQGIDLVFYVTVGICIFVFSVVASISIYSGIKFRVRPDDESDGPPIHGHTGLEILWTAVPTTLVTIIAVLSAIVLAQNDRTKGNALRVDVRAQQFAWQFTYPTQGKITSAFLYLPVGRSTKLYLESKHTDGSPDVIHSFWVPEFGQKQDVVPGITTTLVITPTKVGKYRVICTELCGLGHALMRSRAIVLSEQDFQAWVGKQRKAAAGPPGEQGKALFTSNGCNACHTLTAAKATGAVGPNLDKLDEEKIPGNAALQDYVHESIVNPSAYRRPGYAAQMPPFNLSDDQLDALVTFVVESAKQN